MDSHHFRVFVEGERLRVMFADSEGFEFFVVLQASEVYPGLWWEESDSVADLSLPAWFEFLGALVDSMEQRRRLHDIGWGGL